MRYAEIIEAACKRRAYSDEIESRKRARERIAAADQKRADAARRYRNDLDRAHDTEQKAKRELRRNCSSVKNETTIAEGNIRYLRDRAGVLLGWFEPAGRLLQAKDRHGSIVGWYDPLADQTRDKRGAIVGSGDLLAALLFAAR